MQRLITIAVNRYMLYFLLTTLLYSPKSFSDERTSAQIIQGIDGQRLNRIETAVQTAMEQGDIPGAVVLIIKDSRTVYKKAFGFAQIVPKKEVMTTDRIFDMASVTKPVATATSIMILTEQGKLRLTDRVSKYVDHFSRFRNPDSTYASESRIWHLLTHTSGLPPYTDVKKAAATLGDPCSTADLVTYIAELPKLNAPGEAYHYSCLGYITLNYIIEKVSGKNVSEFAGKNIFTPLGMKYTCFVPDSSLLPLCVPTEVIDGSALRGVVHDPLARLQGGISGNAGLFSTAEDLGRYARMMLNNGTLDDVSILSPVSIQRMTQIARTPCDAARGYGWVVKRGQSWVGGDLLPDGGYGHTGYTGTSLWIDPSTQTAIIILSNRVHPQDDGETDSLRSAIANIVAGALMKL
ncbi:beta-lactamase family protein [candidate division KSB1 bacterium]|nr:beta-lactamase family protein [candidate division KSB1 bacterium]